MSSNVLGSISLAAFTDGIAAVQTALTAAIGTTATIGLELAAVVMGGMLIWRLFKRVSA